MDSMDESERGGAILWIDDDVDLLRQQRFYLEGIGCEVVDIEDVDRAIELIEQDAERYRGIILDCMMSPGKRLRRYDHNAGLRTGLVLLDYLIEHKLVLQGGWPRLFIFTYRIDVNDLRETEQKGFKYHQKQDYPGSKIQELVREEFDL